MTFRKYLRSLTTVTDSCLDKFNFGKFIYVDCRELNFELINQLKPFRDFKQICIGFICIVPIRVGGCFDDKTFYTKRKIYEKKNLQFTRKDYAAEELEQFYGIDPP